jgi:hypothetical protein
MTTPPQPNADGLLNETKTKTKWQRATRLVWCIVVAAVAITVLALGTGLSQADRFASKMSLVALGILLWHLLRQQMIFYVDLKAWTDTVWASDDVRAKAIALLGFCVLFGLLAVAIVFGVASGL